VLIVVQQAFQPMAAVGDGVCGGEVADVAADEVVHAIAAMAGLGQQGNVGQGGGT
jgi:hypothetical protein